MHHLNNQRTLFNPAFENLTTKTAIWKKKKRKKDCNCVGDWLLQLTSLPGLDTICILPITENLISIPHLKCKSKTKKEHWAWISHKSQAYPVDRHARVKADNNRSMLLLALDCMH